MTPSTFGGRVLCLALSLSTAAGCVQVKTTVRTDDVPIDRRVDVTKDPSKATTRLVTRLTESSLSGTVTRNVPCRRITRVSVDRTIHTIRTDASNPKNDYASEVLWAVLGGVFVAGGAALLGTAHLASSAPGHDDNGKETTSPRNSLYISGGIAAGLGLMALIPAVANAGSLKDSSKHVGRVELTEPPIDDMCPESAPGVTVTVTLPNNRKFDLQADGNGQFEFPLPDDKTLYGWKAVPKLRVAAADQVQVVRFDSLRRFQAMQERERAEMARLMAAQMAAEQNLQAITKGDSIWVSLNRRDTRDFTLLAANDASGGLMYALSGRGDLVRSTDGGLAWSAASSPDLKGQEFLTVTLDPRDPDMVLLGSRRGGMLLSHDRGDSWVRLEPIQVPAEGAAAEEPDAGFLRMALVARDPAASADGDAGDAGFLVLAATSEGLYRSAGKAGSEWILIEGLPRQGVKSVATSSGVADRMLVVMDDGGVLRSADSGRSWAPIEVAGLLQSRMPREVLIHPTDASLVYVLAGDSTVLRSRDGGETFETATESLPAGQLITRLELDPKNPTVVYAATTAGILWSTDLASSFRRMNNGIEDADTLRVTGLDLVGGQLYALAGGGTGLLKLGTVTEKQTLSNVSFETNSAAIKRGFFSQLDVAVDLMKRNPSLLLRVDGHTDDRGSADYNDELSWKRARTVCDYFAKKGVLPARLVPGGFGPRHPVATNETDEGRTQNRRVEIYIVGGRS